MGLKQLIQEYPEQFEEVFCNDKRVTADAVEAVFQNVKYAEKGSNRRKREEIAMTYWCDYLMDLEGLMFIGFIQFLHYCLIN